MFKWFKKKEKVFEEWFYNYPLPIDDLDAMENLRKRWGAIVHNSIDEYIKNR